MRRPPTPSRPTNLPKNRRPTPSPRTSRRRSPRASMKRASSRACRQRRSSSAGVSSSSVRVESTPRISCHPPTPTAGRRGSSSLRTSAWGGGLRGRRSRPPAAARSPTSFGDSRFRSETGYLVLAGFIWSPIHYKIRAPGGGIVHGDIELALGGGKMFSRTSQGFAYHAGVLMEVYLLKWLSFRLDIRDILLI